MTDTLIPNYLDTDFSTIKQNIIDIMQVNPVFQDFNYEGSNITVLIELMAYMSELMIFYLNKIAKNNYIDTADLYENVHRLAALVGYYPRGYTSAATEVTFTLTSGITVGDQVTIDAFTPILTTATYTIPDVNNNLSSNAGTIQFCTVHEVQEVVDVVPFTITASVKEGSPKNYSYTGQDLIDGKLFLPSLQYSYDEDLEDSFPSIEVIINGNVWIRVSDFFDEVSGLTNETNVYMFNFTKYKQYVIEFSTFRNMPMPNDTIEITVLETIGKYSNVGANLITVTNGVTIQNNTQSDYLTSNEYTVTNLIAATGGKSFETIDEIKDNAKKLVNTQYRNVTAQDYINYLEAKTDIESAYVWGEQDLDPIGALSNYNKLYITVIPTSWEASFWTTIVNNKILPTRFVDGWTNTISTYLEPRKMLCAYEQFIVPSLIYFLFKIGLKIKRPYKAFNVITDLKNKLTYYFSTGRSFGESISFTEITEFLLDPKQTSETNSFPNIKGITSLIIRNINIYDFATNTWKNPYEFGSSNFPQWSVAVDSTWEENTLRPIKLDNHQYPMLDIGSCGFVEE